MPYSTLVKKECPICNKTYDTINRNQKTCSRQCALKSLTPDRRSEIIKKKYDEDKGYKQRVTNGLKKYFSENPDKVKHGREQSIAVGKGTKGKHKKPDNILEVSLRTTRKILSRLNIGCSRCNWREGVGDIHHINGKKVKDANGHWNLCYLCPNCHRLVHMKIIDKDDLISLEKQIGDIWKKEYFG